MPILREHTKRSVIPRYTSASQQRKIFHVLRDKLGGWHDLQFVTGSKSFVICQADLILPHSASIAWLSSWNIRVIGAIEALSWWVLCCVSLSCRIWPTLILRCKDRSASRTREGYRAVCAGADLELSVVSGVCIVGRPLVDCIDKFWYLHIRSVVHALIPIG